MPYSTQKQEFGNVPVYIMELDLDTCSLTYGTLPCTASGAAGSECYNTFGTCQDTGNFTKATKTYRFSSVRIDDLQAAGDVPTIPSLTNVQTAPTILTPGKGFGVRSTCTVSLTDHPFNDRMVDDYVDNRSYNPETQGTFWGKLIARNQYYENRVMRIKTGYLAADGSYDASNFVTRTYFIDTIKGPDKSGKVTVTGKDVLKFADAEKAQWPVQSEATLDADINNSVTSFVIDDPSDHVKGAYDDTDNVGASQCYIRIDDEIMLVTNMVAGAGTTYTLTVTRASMPSRYQSSTNTADSHEAEATVQHCYEFGAKTPDQILDILLGTAAGISSSYLPTGDWATVVSFGLNSYAFTTLLTEPIGVKDLVEELTQHSLFIWWNERDQEVQMRSIIQQAVDYGPFDDESHIVADSVGVAKNDKGRVSQTWLIYGHRNPTFEMDKFNYFDSVKITVDTTSEDPDAYGQKKVKKIWSRWISVDQGSIASEITNRLNSEYRNTKNIVTATLTPKDDDAWTGNVVTLSTSQLQDNTGAALNGTYIILEVNEQLKPGSVTYKYSMQNIGDANTSGVRTGLIGPNTLLNYGSESEANKDTYAFIAADDRGDGAPGFGSAPNYETAYFIV